MIPPAHIHLLGIGGAAMAPVAGMLAERGFTVTGSDTDVYPPSSTLLESLGIRWKNGFREENLSPTPDLVVIGNVIARGNPELEAVLDLRLSYKSMAAVIEDFFLPRTSPIVVAGTHGKTTTTSLLAWIFHTAGRLPNFLIGGVAENFGRSYGLGGGSDFIIEGDEYETAFFDRGPKFMHYHPDDLILTSLEFDHADIYPDLPAYELAFRRLVNLVPRRGQIFAWGDPEADALRRVTERAHCPVETYGLSENCNWQAGDVHFSEAATHFRVAHRGREVARFRMPVAAGSGRHMVLNALAAASVALHRGISPEDIAQSLATFRSVRRRMEIRGEPAGILVIDDFAHHPTAIRLTIEAARARWPARRIWAVFEPRSNTMRRRIFEDALTDTLAAADVVALGPVHRAQQLPDADRLSPARIVEELRIRGTTASAFDSAEEIAAHIVSDARPADVLLIMSNGSFDGLIPRLLDLLPRRSPATHSAPPASPSPSTSGAAQ